MKVCNGEDDGDADGDCKDDGDGDSDGDGASDVDGDSALKVLVLFNTFYNTTNLFYFCALYEDLNEIHVNTVEEQSSGTLSQATSMMRRSGR